MAGKALYDHGGQVCFMKLKRCENLQPHASWSWFECNFS